MAERAVNGPDTDWIEVVEVIIDTLARVERERDDMRAAKDRLRDRWRQADRERVDMKARAEEAEKDRDEAEARAETAEAKVERLRGRVRELEAFLRFTGQLKDDVLNPSEEE